MTRSLYRFLTSVEQGYALTVLWFNIGLFVLAFCCMFFFPPASVMLVFVGLAGLLVARIGRGVLGIAIHSLARRLIEAGECPACGAERDRAAAADCGSCGAAFDRGAVRPEDVPAPAAVVE